MLGCAEFHHGLRSIISKKGESLSARREKAVGEDYQGSAGVSSAKLHRESGLEALQNQSE
jgi:hypothetical protein